MYEDVGHGFRWICDVCGKVIVDSETSRMDIECKRIWSYRGIVSFGHDRKKNYMLCRDCLFDFEDYFRKEIAKKCKQRKTKTQE